MSNKKFNALIPRIENLLEKLELILPAIEKPIDFNHDFAMRWRKSYAGRGYLSVVTQLQPLALTDLLGIEEQKNTLNRNTKHFIHGLPANNALLWGARGTGKSSLIKALFNEYYKSGLRIIEVNKQDLIDLPDIINILAQRTEYFIIYCDDLSFTAAESGYNTLKAILDGSLVALPHNVIIYATSNRRHLLPEYLTDNHDTRIVDGEIHHSDAVEEKISLSERFGIWLAFHPFSQDQYLKIAEHWLKKLGLDLNARDEIHNAALRWALAHGSRSGRSAWQFARDWVSNSSK